jgi:hypothetical protein
VIVLRLAARHHFDARADGIAIALGSLQMELEPVIPAGLSFIQISAGALMSRDYHVQAAVAVQSLR